MSCRPATRCATTARYRTPQRSAAGPAGPAAEGAAVGFSPLQRTLGNRGTARLLNAGLNDSASTLGGGPTGSRAPSIQRACEQTAPPADLKSLGCEEATTSSGTGTNILFGHDSPALSAADKSTLSAIAAGWHRGGGVATLRIDGFASCDGPADRNWRLSCRRATAVAAELEAPSDGSPGVPNTHLDILAHGETDEFAPGRLPPNRRVVVTGGGAPPPGPPCRLSITGPEEVDHYCAVYVPSDAAACPRFPAPNIALIAAGAAPGASLRWSITRGAGRASIVGPNTGLSVSIRGDAASGAQGDVIVQVTDGACSTTHFLTVRQPSSMAAADARTTTPTQVQDLVTYTVLDQFGNPMGANICWDETVTTCRRTSSGAPRFGDLPTNAAGQVVDQLSSGPPIPGGISASFCLKLDQTITAGGCGPLVHNLIVMRPAPFGVTRTPGAGCAVGDPCP
jgi:outer membrane protein OmpA-like peptidoglycan-associated protein